MTSMHHAILTQPSAPANGRQSAIRLANISVTFGSGKKKIEAVGDVSLDIGKANSSR